MYEQKIQPTLNCGLDMVGEVLYGKWKIRLLWFIDQGYQRPSELQRKIPDASSRVSMHNSRNWKTINLLAKQSTLLFLQK